MRMEPVETPKDTVAEFMRMRDYDTDITKMAEIAFLRIINARVPTLEFES